MKASYDLTQQLQTSLASAGLPIEPVQLLNHVFQFSAEHGSHFHVLLGSILAVQFSDEGGLELHVTSPEFWNQKIKSLRHEHDQVWSVVLHREPPPSRRRAAQLGTVRPFLGKLTLLKSE